MRVFEWRIAILLTFVVGSLVMVILLAPIPQDPDYHLFADRRMLFGIPNFSDVISNLPFLFIGLVGIHASTKIRPRALQIPWMTFFVGVALVSAGSAYYHWAPTSTSLVWDRLPMTVGFMALFVALLGEYIDERLVKVLLGPAIIFGAGTVFYWAQTDDLRFYAWVQFMPLVVVVILSALFRPRYSHGWLLGAALALYAVAKITEAFDVEIFQFLNGVISGHAIKHLLAAAGCFVLIFLLKIRRLLAASPDCI